MPILQSEPFIFPENLLESDSTGNPAQSEMERWWALHTRPRAEKALARLLFRRNVSFFLPLLERRRRIQRRLVRSYLPLFPSYMFVRGGVSSRQTAIETNLVVGSLDVENQKQLSDELTNLYNLIRSGAPLSPEERLQPGMPAEIVSGPLAGLRGRVMQRRGAKTLRFIIEVQLLQQGTSVEIDSSMVQPV